MFLPRESQKKEVLGDVKLPREFRTALALCLQNDLFYQVFCFQLTEATKICARDCARARDWRRARARACVLVVW